MIKNDEHYDHVTDAWQNIMGNNFHFGYFQNSEMELNQATDALIDKMLGMVAVTEESKILDVGCGIGGPALYIAEKFNCSVCGITTSKKGVEIARQKVDAKGYSKQVEFLVADGTKNDLPSGGYDIAWVMESSHLMEKKPLIKECHRLLKPKGTLILCDLMIRYTAPIKNIIIFLQAIRRYKRPKYVYGDSKLFPLASYWKLMHAMGFNEITTVDISEETFPTMHFWKESVIQNKEEILASNSYTTQEIENFVQSCNWLEMVFEHKVMGYAIIKGIKA